MQSKNINADRKLIQFSIQATDANNYKLGTLRNDITNALKCHDYKEGYCAGSIANDRAQYDALNECRRQLGIKDITNLDRWWTDQVKAHTFDFKENV